MRFMASRGNATMQHRAYTAMKEKGRAMNTREIHNVLNEWTSIYKSSGRVVRTRKTYSMNQVAQVLRKSRWFKCVGVEENYNAYGNRSSTIPLYAPLSDEEIKSKIADLLTKDHLVMNIKAHPKFVRDEWKRQENLL